MQKSSALWIMVCMKIVLLCSECEYQESSFSEKELLNKIIMWNHVKKMHTAIAERVMRNYQVLPTHLYGVHTIHEALL